MIKTCNDIYIVTKSESESATSFNGKWMMYNGSSYPDDGLINSPHSPKYTWVIVPLEFDECIHSIEYGGTQLTESNVETFRVEQSADYYLGHPKQGGTKILGCREDNPRDFYGITVWTYYNLAKYVEHQGGAGSADVFYKMTELANQWIHGGKCFNNQTGGQNWPGAANDGTLYDNCPNFWHVWKLAVNDPSVLSTSTNEFKFNLSNVHNWNITTTVINRS